MEKINTQNVVSQFEYFGPGFGDIFMCYCKEDFIM